MTPWEGNLLSSRHWYPGDGGVEDGLKGGLDLCLAEDSLGDVLARDAVARERMAVVRE